MRLNRKEFIERVAERAGISKAAADSYLAALLEELRSVLLNGDSVMIVGFGLFEVITRRARMGRNPKSGEAIQIPERSKVNFRAARVLDESLEGS